MKYLKLFENFNNEDVLYDIEHILVTLNPSDTDSAKPKLLRSELNNNLLSYQLDQNYSKEDLITAISRLDELGYRILYEDEIVDVQDEKKLDYLLRGVEIITLVKSDYFEDKSIKEICIEWLNDNFSNMNTVPSRTTGRILYRNNEENIILYDKKIYKVYTGYSKIWSFFDDFFLLENKEIENIIIMYFYEKYKIRVDTVVLVPELSII
jgi:hypothetical protein